MRRIALLLALAACAPAAGPAPRTPSADPEAAAVWGAALDREYLNDRTYGHFEMVVDTLARPLRDDAMGLRSHRLFIEARHYPPDLLDAFNPPDSAAVRVDVTAVDRAAALRLAPQPADPRAAAEVRRRFEQQKGVAWVSLSRVGFSRDRRMAIVSVFLTCGTLCGHGGVLVLRRGDDGRWVVLDELASMSA